MKKNVLILGATGMVGQLVLSNCLNHPDVATVTIISRRSVGLTHDNLHEVIHQDYLNYDPILHEIADMDIVYFCIGAYTGTLTKEEFRKINVDVPTAFAKAVKQQNKHVRFCLLSGQGADRTEKSKTQFAKDKGAAENVIESVQLGEFHSLRPGYIYPVSPRKEPNFMYKLMRSLYPIINPIFPNMSITSTDLANAMVQMGHHGHVKVNLENKDLRDLTKGIL